VELHGLLANVLEICRQDITAKRLDVHLGLHAQHTHLNADPARLQQILWNVLQNAVKFTGAEGRISLKTSNIEDPSSSGKRLRIEIADSGIGIEPERLEQIFRPFEQGNVAITKQFGGLGLGLAITKMLVDMHEGSITARSEGDDQGSTFVLEFSVVEEVGVGPDSRLPLQSSSSNRVGSAALRQDYSKVAGGDQRKPKILLVDDHADTSASIRILLERRGYAVTVADTMKNAIAAFSSDEFDLIISDIGLPDGSGWELISSIRERSNVHAIAVSGFCTEQDIERSKKAGFDVHLTKPFNFNDLHREIQSLILQTATP
jgi:CheY-like chemotaxis protein